MGCTGRNQISEQEFQNMVGDFGEIKTYQSETIIKHNFLDKEFKSISEIVTTLKECQVKDHHSKINSLFLHFVGLQKILILMKNQKVIKNAEPWKIFY